MSFKRLEIIKMAIAANTALPSYKKSADAKNTTLLVIKMALSIRLIVVSLLPS